MFMRWSRAAILFRGMCAAARATQSSSICIAVACHFCLLLLLQAAIEHNDWLYSVPRAPTDVPHYESEPHHDHDREQERTAARARLSRLHLEPAVTEGVVCRTFRSPTVAPLLEAAVLREAHLLDCGSEACTSQVAKLVALVCGDEAPVDYSGRWEHEKALTDHDLQVLSALSQACACAQRTASAWHADMTLTVRDCVQPPAMLAGRRGR